jgi:hypothetical protein
MLSGVGQEDIVSIGMVPTRIDFDAVPVQSGAMEPVER